MVSGPAMVRLGGGVWLVLWDEWGGLMKRTTTVARMPNERMGSVCFVPCGLQQCQPCLGRHGAPWVFSLPRRRHKERVGDEAISVAIRAPTKYFPHKGYR